MSVGNCRILNFAKISSENGSLTAIEAHRHVPFEIKRVYYLYDVPGGGARGEHAHKALEQVIIAMSGSFDVHVDDGRQKTTFHLNRSYQGLYLAPGTWRRLDNFSSASVCVVLASAFFSESDYIRNYDEFLKTRESLL
jgi:glyoxylate utilization-related uncharacterized protein